MQVRELAIADAWEFTPRTHGDSRGLFYEWYRADVLRDATGRDLHVAQANQSVSARGVVRGVHSSSVPPGQAKFVYCPSGVVLDVVVDIRAGSPTFGQWDAVQLDDVDHKAVFISEGLGHAFISLVDDSAVGYLCSTGYDPSTELAINPLDPDLGLPWPAHITPVISDRDRSSASLASALADGTLPDYDRCQAFYASLRG